MVCTSVFLCGGGVRDGEEKYGVWSMEYGVWGVWGCTVLFYCVSAAGQGDEMYSSRLSVETPFSGGH